MSGVRAALAAAVADADLTPFGGPASGGQLAHAFPLPAEGGSTAVLTLVDVPRPTYRDPRARARLLVPIVASGGSWAIAVPGDGAWRALALAMAAGRTVPDLDDAADVEGSAIGHVAAALVCRPGPGLPEAWPGGVDALASAVEASAGVGVGEGGVADWSVGDRRTGAEAATAVLVPESPGAADAPVPALVLRAYSPVEPGLEPDLELTALLGEESGLAAVPAVVGWAEVVTRTEGPATVAMLGAHDCSARPLDVILEERLVELAVAPGAVALEWATEIGRDLGSLVGAIHAALSAPPVDAPDLAPHSASRDEIHAWRAWGRRVGERAMARLRATDRAAARRYEDLAPGVAERVARFEALPAAPTVMRVHGRLGLAAIRSSEAGAAHVVGFAGPEGATRAERRRSDAPLLDVAWMLRSIDVVARRARAVAAVHRGAVPGRSALDPMAWRDRTRGRFLEAYRRSTGRLGRAFEPDADLLEAFEVVVAAQLIADARDTAEIRTALDALAELLGEG